MTSRNRRRPCGTGTAALFMVLLLGPAGCASSSAVLALPPDFEVMTSAGVASVSIREPLPGATDAETVKWVRSGMEQAAPSSVIAGPVKQPYPSQRIVWHVDQTASRGMVRLIVNVFDGVTPYAYAERNVANDAPTGAITSKIESMSKQLLSDVANMPPRQTAQAQIADQMKFQPRPESQNR